jgi:hypothetical protein
MRITLSLAGLAMLAGVYPVAACAQIATPVVASVPGAPAEIAFDLYRANRIVLAGTVNGTATEMLLDSGAGVTTIDRDFAKAIGLKKGMAIQALGSGGTQSAELVQDVTLEAGNLKLSGVTVAVIDLDSVEKAIGRPIPVILGRELFMNSVVAFDFQRQRISLSPSGSFTAPAGATQVALKRDGTLHYLPISVDGLPPVEAALDLGNGGALSLSSEYRQAHPKLEALPYAIGLAGGVGGVHEIKRVTLPKLEMAGFVFNDVPADLGAVAKGPYAGRANAGIQLFKPFQLTLDLGHDRLWLKRTGHTAEFSKDRAGMFLVLENDHFNVLHVSPGSPAAKAGLTKGDRIVAVEGETVGPGFYSSAQSNWARGAAGTKVTLVKAGGEAVALTLADYY